MLLTILLAGFLPGCLAAPSGFANSTCFNRTDPAYREHPPCDVGDSVYFNDLDQIDFIVSGQGNGTTNVSSHVNQTEEFGWNGRTQYHAEPLAASEPEKLEDAYTLNITLATNVVSATPSTFESIMSWMWNLIATPELADLKVDSDT